MKTASKVFIWIGMIVGSLLIFPIIVGVLALKKINESESSQDLQTMGILTLFFCNMLGGIFMLCIKENELNQNPYTIATTKQSNNTYKILIILSLISSIINIIHFILLFFVGIEMSAYLILMILCFVLNISLIIVFYVNQHLISKDLYNKINKTNLVCLVVISILSILIIATTSATLVFMFNSIKIFMLIYSLMIFFMIKINAKNLDPNNNPINHVTKIEVELNKLQMLYTKNVITESEYKKMRASIIDKYSK